MSFCEVDADERCDESSTRYFGEEVAIFIDFRELGQTASGRTTRNTKTRRDCCPGTCISEVRLRPSCQRTRYRRRNCLCNPENSCQPLASATKPSKCFNSRTCSWRFVSPTKIRHAKTAMGIRPHPSRIQGFEKSL